MRRGDWGNTNGENDYKEPWAPTGPVRHMRPCPCGEGTVDVNPGRPLHCPMRYWCAACQSWWTWPLDAEGYPVAEPPGCGCPGFVKPSRG
jgi:hypothetical protein